MSSSTRRSARAEGALALLRRLDRLRAVYGAGASEQKRALLRGLDTRSLPRAGDVRRLHEILCFWRAYPDDAALLSDVERVLDSFERRTDVRRHREALVDSGIAGTPIVFRFFQPTASWLARRLGDRLGIEWKGFARRSLLDRWLPLLSLYAETPALDEIDHDAAEWIARMKGPDETDAAYLIRRFDALAIDPFLREKLYDELDVPIRLDSSPSADGRARPVTPGRLERGAAAGMRTAASSSSKGTVTHRATLSFERPADGSESIAIPSRTQARYAPSPVVYQTRPLDRTRPRFPADLLRPPRAVRAVSRREGQALIDLAREAMIVRSRDLDVFCWGDPNDVRMIECGEGLQFACIGAVPERRLLLEAVYGLLTLKNGVPIGYVLVSALFGSSEIAYNVFESYRGGEAARIYGRVLAAARSVFEVDAFTIFPYQLGEGNEEAIRSGAWWFYRKLGFVPRDPALRRVMRGEMLRLRRDREHRSSLATLRRLAGANLYFWMGRPREDVIGLVPLAEVGLAVTRSLAARFGSDREGASRALSRDAAHRLGVRSLRGWTRGERLAWDRWAPLVTILPGLERWPAADRRALAAVVRAKGGRRESEFVARFDRHRRLRQAIRDLGGSEA